LVIDMGTSENRKPHSGETVLSLFILALLAVIAATVLHVQQEFNPAVEVKHRVGSLSTEDAVPADTTPDLAPLFPLPSELKTLSPMERFAAQNLSDKINGKAELYLSSGFVELQSQRFQDRQDADFWAEAFVYDMGAPENAFAVFSAQRRGEAEPLDLTTYAYRTANALFFIHGTYYVEMIGATATPSDSDPLRQLATAFMAAHSVGSAVISEQDLFPEEGLDRESIVRVAENAFGFDRLDDVYTAEYQVGDEVATLFLSRRSSSEAAGALASEFHKFLLEFGGADQKWDAGLDGALAVELMDLHEVIFSRGPFLAGVHEADSRELAQKLALRLADKLMEATDDAP
jgi:Family of unknown function (DUF6599)